MTARKRTPKSDPEEASEREEYEGLMRYLHERREAPGQRAPPGGGGGS